MIVDVNAYLGHFVFRQLRYNTAASLLALMDSKGIDKAVVSSASAITYRNSQAGNEEVAEEVRGHSDRLISFAVINPFYAGWQYDLKICHEEFGMAGLRLYPKWHNYQLSSACCRELVNAATERGMAISIPIRVEDNRQRSWLLNVPDVPLDEIVELMKAHPKARFILLNGIGYTRCPLGRKDNGLPSNYAIGLSRLSAVLANELGQLITNLGAERVMFGTGMPFKYPDPALVKLEVLDASEADKEKIRSENAITWLGL
ncbi:MAG: amidohydrolase family protein [Planctomycetota bacterium]|jgi:predicted TIM-barrel fold metal-dependent hydrolase